jgi:hypothetical protein
MNLFNKNNKIMGNNKNKIKYKNIKNNNNKN